MNPDLVPADFVVPVGIDGPGFTLRPLAEAHNARDFAAWTSSMGHIRATPGFEGRPWPHAMTLEENLRDVRGHVDDFANRRGFTYTVMEGEEVVGCVYVYPSDKADRDANARSWVRADRAQLDVVIYQAVSQWLADAWPFTAVDYASR